MANNKVVLKQGFTLVELSIVIIIIGFLIAGIAAGNSLIKQADLNRLINTVTNTATAMHNFKSVYGYWPGDFPHASAYWPSLQPSATLVGVFGTTVDGNGNGIVKWDMESYLAWAHINASNIAHVNNNEYNSGDDPYAVHLQHGGLNNIVMQVLDLMGQPAYGITPIHLNLMILNKVFDPYGYGFANVISPIDAYNIDAKIDDGLPATGNLIAHGDRDPSRCVVPSNGVGVIQDFSGGQNANGSSYDKSYSGLGCSELYYRINED